MLSRQIEQTRQVLRKLFHGDRLPFLPKTFERGGQVEFTGAASMRRLVTGRAKALVSPTGFEGLCSAALHAWEIPFQGMVVAA